MKAPLRFAILYERKVILLLCAIGALRVFIFSAAFPFFNNVDEQAHVDLVMKYARGHVPRDLGQYTSESAYYICLYGNPEFFMAPQQYEAKVFPPPNWMWPAEQRDDVVKRNSDWWRANQNHESGEPPLYYALAGLWLNLGRVSGITGGWLLYWVRFLNMFVAAALVWVGFVAAKLVRVTPTMIRYDFTGKAVLVTGSSRGMGAAILEAFGRAGPVCLAHFFNDPAGQNRQDADATAERIRQHGATAHVLEADGRRFEAADRL